MEDALCAVLLSPNALCKVRQSALSWRNLETGGVLLGYRDGRTLRVLEAVAAGADARRTFAGCALRVEEILSEAERMALQFEPTLDLLGIWHSHPGADPVASDQDHETLRQVVGLNGRPMLSLIVSREDPRAAGLWCLFGLDEAPVQAVSVQGGAEWVVRGVPSAMK